MARHRGGAPKKATAGLSSFLGESKPKPKKKRAFTVSRSKFVVVLEEMTALMEQGRIAEAKGKHFVALYADLHYRVYGVEALELDSKARAVAGTMAQRMIDRDFDGSAEAMAEFVQWTWTRENRSEQWRREHPDSGGRRMTWRSQFSTWLLSDFKVAQARKKSGSAPDAARRAV